MTDLYDILKANRLKKESDPWLCILGEAWMSSEEDYKEYTALVPYTFIGNGQPLVSWMIKGNTVQSSTPTPTVPIQPSECGDMSSNLWSYHPDTTSGGVRLLWDGEKINYSNTCTRSANSIMTIDLKKGTYTLKVNANRIPVKNDFSCIDIYHPSSGLFKRIINEDAVNGKVTFTLDDDLSNVSLRIRLNKGTNYDGFEIRPMLNIGETSLPYDVYGQYKIPISSANTTTPIYLGEVQSTRQIKKLVLTGSEMWYLYSAGNIHQFYTQDMRLGGVALSSAYSTIAPYGMTANNRKGNYGCYPVTSGDEIAFQMYGSKADFPTQTEWKSYLTAQYAAGTPVIIWYVLATPTTDIVNEPLRKIGDYADSISDVISIPTVRGENVFDVDTEVKPSEVYIKYKNR